MRALNKVLVFGVACVFAASMLAIVGCSSQSSSSSSSTQEVQAGDMVVSLEVMSPAANDSVACSEEVEAPEESTVLELFGYTDLDVVVEDGPYGAFVASINGVANEGTKGWTYTVNEEQIQESAANVKVTQGDSVQWSYIDMAE